MNPTRLWPLPNKSDKGPQPEFVEQIGRILAKASAGAYLSSEGVRKEPNPPKRGILRISLNELDEADPDK
jgi:hypothetical protein